MQQMRVSGQSGGDGAAKTAATGQGAEAISEAPETSEAGQR